MVEKLLLNQAEVNFSKWHFNNSQFSKVNLCQKSNWKVKVKLPKSNFRKCNFKRQISNVKFQVEFPTSNFQREPFQIQFSFQLSKSNFEGQLEVIRACFSKSTTLWKSNNSNSNAWKWNVSKSDFDRHISKGNIFRVKSTTRFGSIESRQRRKSSIRKSVCSLRFFSAAEKT